MERIVIIPVMCALTSVRHAMAQGLTSVLNVKLMLQALIILRDMGMINVLLNVMQGPMQIVRLNSAKFVILSVKHVRVPVIIANHAA